MATGYVNVPIKPTSFNDLLDVDTTGVSNNSLIRWNSMLQIWEPLLSWEDLRFPATSINPIGPVSSATYEPDNLAFSFADAQTNSIGIIAQIPHSWKLGTELHPHIHWHPTSADTGNVLWRMEYKWTNPNEAESGSWTSIDCLEAGMVQ